MKGWGGDECVCCVGRDRMLGELGNTWIPNDHLIAEKDLI